MRYALFLMALAAAVLFPATAEADNVVGVTVCTDSFGCFDACLVLPNLPEPGPADAQLCKLAFVAV